MEFGNSDTDRTRCYSGEELFVVNERVHLRVVNVNFYAMKQRKRVHGSTFSFCNPTRTSKALARVTGNENQGRSDSQKTKII